MKLYHFFSRRLFWLSIISIVVITLSQLLGRKVWQLELFSHYVPHVAILVLLAALIYPKTKPNSFAVNYSVRRSQFLRSFLALVGVSLFVWSLQPLSLLVNGTIPNLDASSNAIAPTVIAYQNVNVGNSNPEKAIQRLIGSDDNSAPLPAVVALVEAGGANWQKALNKLTMHYPTHCGINESNPFAMQVYAKDVGAKCEIFMLMDFPLAKLTLPVHLNLTNHPIHQSNRIIYVAHPPPPISQSMAQSRNTYLSDLAKLIKADSEHAELVVGDLNLSAFSPIYRDFIKSSQVSNAMTNTSLQRTTLTGLPTWLPFGIGIDHILVNASTNAQGDNVKTHAKGWHGSDHRGFWIEWD